MSSRDEHLAWCKHRALRELDHGDAAGAVATMISDLGKWSEGEMYDGHTLNFLAQLGMIEVINHGDIRRYIEGFN